MSSRPAFIPKDQVVRGVDYPGYVAYSEGLRRKDTTPLKGSGYRGTLRMRQAPATVQIKDHGVAPVRRRTHQEQAESLARRIWAQYNSSMGLSESVFKEVQAVCWDMGFPVSFDQARELAEHYLAKNDHLVKEERQKEVTSQSPYVLAGEEMPEPEKDPGLIYTPVGKRGKQ